MEENLLQSLKSLSNLKFLFSFLVVEKKLNIIVYNKKIKRKLGIDIQYHKKVSGKYRIMQKNGYIEEYDLYSNILIFKGMSLNGKKNGQGTEFYNNGDIKFEGEYLNGYKIQGKGYDHKKNVIMILEKDGKCMEYYDNGNLYFKGEYLKGKKWNGKIFNYRGNKISEIKNGKGNIQEYYYDGKLLFKGIYLNGKKWNGKEYFNYNILKPKEFEDKKGYNYINNNIFFVGEFSKGKIFNIKKYEIEESDEYKNNGDNKEYTAKKRIKNENEYSYYNNKIFEGTYINDRRWEGYRKRYDNTNKLIFEEHYINGEIRKVKEYNFQSQLLFDGEYLNGERNGKGKEYFYNGSIIYEGDFLNGKRNGIGKEFNVNGELEYEGEFLNGKRDGIGKEYSPENNSFVKVEYYNGKKLINEIIDEDDEEFCLKVYM